jgi:hypothetical protein
VAIQLQSLLEKYGLLHQVTAFVKDENNNLTVMAITLQSIIDYEPLKLLMVYEGTCFGHIMFKVCQYVTNDDKVFIGLKSVSVKDAQVGCRKNLPRLKFLGKGDKSGSRFVVIVGCNIGN